MMVYSKPAIYTLITIADSITVLLLLVMVAIVKG
jgi:hypothetical protein